MYRIFNNNDINLTASGKKVSQLEGLVTFIDPPYRESYISLYSHQNNPPEKTILAIRVSLQ
jgi:hypothetical protein